MAPLAGRACMSVPRAATSRHASFRVKMPAAWAAAISPIECPARWCGVTPKDSTRRYSAVSMAKRADWV